MKSRDRLVTDVRCLETRMGRLISGKAGTPDEMQARVSPFMSMRNRPNNMNIVYKYGKRAGQLKSWKHKDCDEIV